MENIIENNRLIAEFLGFQLTDLGWFDSEEVLSNIERDNTFDNLKFHYDWNWLIKIVEKILNVSLEIDSMEMYYNITDSIPYIAKTYGECVEFIKWYNEKNQ